MIRVWRCMVVLKSGEVSSAIKSAIRAYVPNTYREVAGRPNEFSSDRFFNREQLKQCRIEIIEERLGERFEGKAWEYRIGGEVESLPDGADLPLRSLVWGICRANNEDIVSLFSGWEG